MTSVVYRRALLVCVSIVAGCTDGRPQPAEMSGRDMYVRFCASCHGAEGRGDGPAASSLQPPPSDLTTLGDRADGFDAARVMRVIDGRRAVAAHGAREMPVWGAVFEEELAEDPYTRYTALLRSQALVEYLRSIQRSGDPSDPGADSAATPPGAGDSVGG